MKSLFEYLKEAQSFEEFVNGEQIDEGLKEWVNKIKTKFSQVFNYLRGVVVKIGDYFMSVDGDGNVMPCITPPTSGNAYKNGLIDKKSTFIHVDKESSKIVKLNNKFNDALSLYPKESSLKYWDRMLNENVESNYDPICEDFKTINEVKLHTDDPEAKYNIIVDDDGLKAEIKMNLLDHELARLMIWGAPGIGKTAILSNVLEEMKKEFPNYNLIVKTLSNETPDNFTLPKYIDVEGQEFATDVPKTWLPVYKPSGDPTRDKQLDDMCGAG
ncbi:MAG: hypothetical protein IKU29_08225, partial [Parabacteroides sp.]|nr:hypothetical protein [Parabacteroides sp.]